MTSGRIQWLPAHAKLHTALRESVLLPRNAHLLVAVSGGQDSLCLAQLLLDLREKWGWQVGLAHCDHRWQDESAANARHVQQWAKPWQVPCYVETAVTPPASEAAARQWRYQVFEALAKERGYTHVVTGHTATDRAETLLYNLLRGSGTDGLKALAASRPLAPSAPELTLVRPLLAFTRADTGAVCQTLDLPVWEDATNQDLRYRRNRIRQELMPYLRSHFNPNVEATLAQTANILTADVAYLQAQTQQLYSQVVETVIDGWHIHRLPFRQAPLALQRRVARRLLQLALERQPSFEHIEKIVALADAPNLSQTDPFPGKVMAQIRGEVLWLGRP
ncbi:MAG: tRNA lysidine(34) synthetase TilS [Cyanobacteria bacterium P01_A01_bin.105]